MYHMKTKVSIIVPMYQAAAFLRETIESVRSQEEQDWELLLVDDCSRDEGPEIVLRYGKEDSRIRLLRQPENLGAAAARNRGLEEASGRYIAFLDSDDLWKQDRLSAGLAFMEARQAGFVFSGYEFADESGKGTGRVVRVPETLSYRQALKNTTIFTSTVLFDTHIVPKALLCMPPVKSEDTAAWWNILRHGYTAYGLDRNLVLYRRSTGTLSSNKIEAIRRIWNLYRRVEGLSLPYSMYNFIFYAVRAVLRRV